MRTPLAPADVRLSVLIPVYNEIATIDRILDAVHAIAVPKEVICVDDGSSDGTRERLAALHAAGRYGCHVTTTTISREQHDFAKEKIARLGLSDRITLLFDDYRDQIKSEIADLANTGGRPAGSITAALFLSKFAGDWPWVHLDIASTDWSERERAYVPKGPSGIGTRLLIQYLIDRTL